jgi:hypothetical protein
MARAVLIEDRGLERDYKIATGQIITLVFDESNLTISFQEDGEDIGDVFEFEDEFETEKRFLLKRMYSPDQYKRQGLGRAVLELFNDIIEGTIYTRPNDGQRRKDQSHLTGDAPAFVMSMQEEGLIEDDYDPDISFNDLD